MPIDAPSTPGGSPPPPSDPDIEISGQIAEDRHEERIEEDGELDIEPSPDAGTMSGDRSIILSETERLIHESKSHYLDKKAVFSILLNHLPEEGLNLQFIRQIHQILHERYGDASPTVNTLAETSRFLQSSESLFEDSSSIFEQLSKNPEYSNILEKKEDIIFALALPVLNGHLTAEDVLALATEIEISDTPLTTSKYEEAMSYSPGGAIKIVKSVLKDKFVSRDGKAMDLDLVQMISHELGHGIIAATKRSEQEPEIDGEVRETQRSLLLSEAKKILHNTEEYYGFQPQHVQNVLSSLEKSNFGALLPEEKAKWGSEEKYLESRDISSAEEIIADYSGIYIQADGSFLGFVKECLGKVDPVGFSKFGSSDLGIDSVGPNESGQLIGRYIEIADKLSRKEMTLDQLRESNPGIARAIESYLVFYNAIRRVVSSNKGRFGEDLGDSYESSGNYVDGPMGQQGSSQDFDASSSGFLAVSGAFVGAFASANDVWAPIVH